jgi:shikimate dehydrogenase
MTGVAVEGPAVDAGDGIPDDGTYMGFVGVSTGQSSIRAVFPIWACDLGLPTGVLVGHDVVPGSPPEVYRELVGRIRDDSRHRGALVTTHKVAVHDACLDMFDELDELATTFGEISAIFKRDGRLCGAAKDPVTVRLALDEFLPTDHFAATGAEVLCLGSGGAGMALSHQLGVRPDRPAGVTCTALDARQLDHLRALHERAGLPADLFRYAVTPTPSDADALIAELPPASLVVNATGMGKDLPGSPLTDEAVWPEGAVVWEFNYRGSLEFLHQAEERRTSLGLTIEDGWRYFVHGWSQVIADVFDVPMPHETVVRLAALAASVR